MTFIAHFALAACTANESAGLPPPEDSGAGDSAADTADTAEPAVVAPTWTWQGHTAVEVVAREYAACAMDDQGTIECWATQDSSTRVSDEPLGGLRDIAVSPYHACGIASDGLAECWGCGTYSGESGERSADYGQCEPPPLQFLKLSLVSTTSCGLTAEGEVWCWGGSVYGEPNPHQTATDVLDFSITGLTCTIQFDKSLNCAASASRPTHPEMGNVVRVDTADREVCVQDAEGYVTCWGEAEYHGELPLVKAVDFAAGKMSACLIHESDGRIECIGPDQDKYPLPTGRYTQIAGNSWLGYAIRDDGVLVRWGDPDEDVSYDD